MIGALFMLVAAAPTGSVSIHEPDRPSSVSMRIDATCLDERIELLHHTNFGVGAASTIDAISIGDRKIAPSEVVKLSPPPGALIDKVFIANCGRNAAEGFYVDVNVAITDASSARAGIPRVKTYRITHNVTPK